jgi:hypothetical protein
VVLVGIVRLTERRTRTVADELRMALTELPRKADAGDAEFLREGVRMLAQTLMEREVAQPTANIYGHLRPDAGRKTAEAIGLALFGQPSAER